MTQVNGRGMDSGFIELAQEQLESVNAQLAQVEEDMTRLQEARVTLLGQRTSLQNLVSPSTQVNARQGVKAEVQSTRDAVVDLVRERGAAMHYRDDIYPGLVRAGHEISGQDPANTLLSRILSDERLRRTAPGTYGLAEWEGELELTTPKPVRPAPHRHTVADAAERVLREAGAPLHYAEIAKRMLKSGLWATKGETPGATVSTRLYKDVADRGRKSVFLKLGGGMFGLRGRDEAAA